MALPLSNCIAANNYTTSHHIQQGAKRFDAARNEPTPLDNAEIQIGLRSHINAPQTIPKTLSEKFKSSYSYLGKLGIVATDVAVGTTIHKN